MQRITKYFKLFWPLFFVILIWFIFSSPYFLKGLVPYSSTYQVNFFPPWSHYQKFLGPVKNNAMPDVHTQIFPWKKITIDSYKNGQIPFWNPYNFSGNPHLANFQTAAFTPLNILFSIFSFINAWSILILLQPLLAGAFMFLLMKELKLSNGAAIISSTTFMFCGFIVVWMAYGTLSYAILFLPLALFAIEKFINSKRKIFLGIFCVTIPLSIFSGHFQTSIYFLMTCLGYILWSGFVTKNKYSFLYLLGAFAIGLLVSSLQIIPSVQFYKYSVRSELYITGGGIPLKYLITGIAPDFFGNPVTRNDWFGYYAEWASFIGIIPFMLALIGSTVNRKKNFFVVCALIVLFLAIDSPVQAIIGSLKIPVLSTSNPSRIIVLYSFALSVLAGFGLDSLKQLKDRFKLFMPVLLTGGILVCVWVLLLFLHPMEADKLVIAKRNLIIPSILYAITSIVLLFSIFVNNRKLVLFGIYVLIALSSIDSLRYAQKWMPFDPKDLVYPQVPVISAIEKNIGYGRMFGNFGGELSGYYRIPSIEGYDPLYIERYGEFLRAADNGTYMPAERSVAKIVRNGKYTNKALDLLGVNLIFHPIADTNQSWAYPVWKDSNRFGLVYSDDVFQLFKNKYALGRVYLYYHYTVEPDKKKILQKFYSEEFDIKENILLEEDPGWKQTGNTQEGAANITYYSPNIIHISVNTAGPAILFLSDNFYPGWHATVQQGNSIKEVKIYRADYTFRAIVVPSGNSVVTFSYNPLGWSNAPSVK